VSDVRRTVRTFVLYEEVGRGPTRYRVVPVDHEENTPWRAGCCVQVEGALAVDAIVTVMESENQDDLGFRIQGVARYGEESKSLSIKHCPMCGGDLVFKVVRHTRRHFKVKHVRETTLREEWTYEEEQLQVVA